MRTFKDKIAKRDALTKISLSNIKNGWIQVRPIDSNVYELLSDIQSMSLSAGDIVVAQSSDVVSVQISTVKSYFLSTDSILAKVGEAV